MDQQAHCGYSLLAAAQEGCASCVEYWLGRGVDPNFEGNVRDYTAMDFVQWAEKKSHISAESAMQVKEVLEAAGGHANEM